MSTISVANGLMEAVLERRMETIRSTDEQSKTFIQKQQKWSTIFGSCVSASEFLFTLSLVMTRR